MSAAAAATPRCERFDVQRARCTLREDEDALRSAIEDGTGCDAFNAWMHELLISSAGRHELTGSPGGNGATAVASQTAMTLP